MRFVGNFRQRLVLPCAILATALCLASRGRAQDLDAARKLFISGKYEECNRVCEKVEPNTYPIEDWRLLQAKTLLAIGRYPQAEAVVSNALTQSENSIRLRLLGFETANSVGDTDLAQKRLREINTLGAARIWAYRDPLNIVALGRAALLLGADPRTVLERVFDEAQKADPNLRDTYLASGELALDKHDYAIAANKFNEALKKFPDDPDMLYGLARAYQPNARGKMLELLETVLEENENHVPGMLLLVDNAIDAEEYTEAAKLLTRALKVNPWNPEAWAYRAVIAHLRNDPAAETEARQKALHYWPTNPKVDYIIGMKLSQNYRFAEGSAHQRKALAFDPGFLPAKAQLSEDLLRLGEEDEGWKLAEDLHKEDGYDVTAYNLVNLRVTLEKFQTLTNQDFMLRMSPYEAALYGDRALALLQQAKDRLTAKYGVTLDRPTVVEIFPEQKDFGVRTFGMPHNPGFLGVCFGSVVTANSPESQGGTPANWEAVLWHEFCHVVTLHLTKNKMPRWLSEGISVYEELQANPTWGQTMNPNYREMVLGEDLTPVSDLSAAFMSPKSDLHVQFAYYESSLVVEFLVGKYGFDNLEAILKDLGDGVNINEAIPKHTAPMKQIEKEFEAYAKAKAEALGPELDWKKPEPRPSGVDFFGLPNVAPPPAHSDESSTNVAAGDSKNYWELMRQAATLVSEKNWEAAKAPLNTLIQFYPNQSGPDNAYAMMAAVHRGLNETALEQAALEKWAALDDAAPDAYARLMEIATDEKNWNVVTKNAERFIAVNPLLPQPYRFLGRADEELGQISGAISAYQKLLLLDPADPADVHYRLASLLYKDHDPSAKRQVLQALEEAPRFRDAHRLLLEIVQSETTTTNAPTAIQP